MKINTLNWITAALCFVGFMTAMIRADVALALISLVAAIQSMHCAVVREQLDSAEGVLRDRRKVERDKVEDILRRYGSRPCPPDCESVSERLFGRRQ